MFVLADAGMGKTTLDDIEKINDKSNTLLLLDSLDEDPQCKTGGTEERLTKVLEASEALEQTDSLQFRPF